MSGLFGSQGDTIGENAFTWASQLVMNINVPAANLTGTVSYGYITLNSLHARDDVAAISINDLLRTSTRTVAITPNTKSVTLSAGVVNHDIVSYMNVNVGLSGGLEMNVFGGEVVAYAIIHRPGQNITAGSNTPYAIDATVRCNYVYTPKLWDAFARSLGNTSSTPRYKLKAKALHGNFLSRLIKSPYNPLKYLPEPKSGTPIGDILHRLYKLY